MGFNSGFKGLRGWADSGVGLGDVREKSLLHFTFSSLCLYSQDRGFLGLAFNQESPGCKTGVSQRREISCMLLKRCCWRLYCMNDVGLQYPWITLSKMNTREVSTRPRRGNFYRETRYNIPKEGNEHRTAVENIEFW